MHDSSVDTYMEEVHIFYASLASRETFISSYWNFLGGRSLFERLLAEYEKSVI